MGERYIYKDQCQECRQAVCLQSLLMLHVHLQIPEVESPALPDPLTPIEKLVAEEDQGAAQAAAKKAKKQRQKAKKQLQQQAKRDALQQQLLKQQEQQLPQEWQMSLSSAQQQHLDQSLHLLQPQSIHQSGPGQALKHTHSGPKITHAGPKPTQSELLNRVNAVAERSVEPSVSASPLDCNDPLEHQAEAVLSTSQTSLCMDTSVQQQEVQADAISDNLLSDLFRCPLTKVGFSCLGAH